MSGKRRTDFGIAQPKQRTNGFKFHHVNISHMTLRDVKPFDAKQWAQLQQSMKDGPTDEQVQKILKARKRAQNIRRENF